MRTITLFQIAVFLSLVAAALSLAILTTDVLLGHIALGDFRGIVLVGGGVLLLYAYALIIYRTFLRIFPLQSGPITPGSGKEFGYHIYLLFHLVLFHPLTRSLLIPVPLMRLIYIGLGARFGANSYSAGTLLDPPLTIVGDNSIIGHDAVLFCHVIEGNELSHSEILIGNNVTIGAKAVVMPGVTIEDGAIVAVNAVVAKGTKIRAGELWGGVPARKIR